MKIYNSVTELVGKTPILKLNNYGKDLEANILAKIEFFNPTGSVKDRAALSLIEEYEKSGILTKNSVLIEPTSGNTGIGIAAIASAKGYEVILTMPESMSVERRNLLKAYGAKLVLTDAKKGMSGAIEKANELQKEMDNAVILGQFDNPANPLAHYNTTAPEIWEDTDGKVDIFVCGVGTAGTIAGISKFLKEKNPNIKIVAIEPDTSAVLSGEKAGPHGLQGIGAGFIPPLINMENVDEILKISVDDAYATARKLVLNEGILVGISSGAALFGATLLAEKSENKGKNIVVLLPDTGERYLSTPLFQ